MNIPSFPKISHIGEKWISDIFLDPVEITEKVDGSQWCFGRLNGDVVYRSRGKQQFRGAVDTMFTGVAEYIDSIADSLPDGMVFFSECVNKPKHNIIAYDSTPRNNLYLFGASDHSQFISTIEELRAWAETLSISPPNVLYCGMSSPQHLMELLDTDSFLGRSKVEGVVVKNYNRMLQMGGYEAPIMCGKFVSEKFKEKHSKNWKAENTSGGKWNVFCDGYKSEARWEKAVQHLREAGRIEDSPRDIGALIKEVLRDIEVEEADNIKEFLYAQYGRDLKRRATSGLPEWYKSRLAGV